MAGGVLCAQETDSDRDGIVDKQDVCKMTPAGAEVDCFGCALDSDMDGVINLYDRCADTPFSDFVEEDGCSKNKE